MLSIQVVTTLRLLVVASWLAAATVAQAQTPVADGVVIDVSGANRVAYPMAIAPGFESDAALARMVAEVAAFDFSLVGFFKVIPQSAFWADLQAEKLGITPANWNAVGAFGVIKHQVTAQGDEVGLEMHFFEVSKGGTATLSQRYKGKKRDVRGFVHAFCNDVVMQLTGTPGFFGSQIAFVAKGKGKGKSAIYAMDFDGASPRSLTRNASVNLLPAFSPSGAKVAFTSYMRGNPDLYVVDAGGGRPARVSSARGMNTGAAWSPDGTQLAVTLSRDGNAEIYVISAMSGAVVRRLTNDRAIDTSPAWSPDGSEIAFVSDRGGSPQIYVMSATGGTPKRVSPNGDYNTTPTWSPQKGARMLAYTTRDGSAYDIVTLDLATGNMKRITQRQGSNEDPAFAPNGRAIAFARTRGGESGVYIASLDGGPAVRVYEGSVAGVDWGPARK